MLVHYLAFEPAEHQQQVTFPRRHMLAVKRLMQRIEAVSVQVKYLLLILLKSAYATQDSLHAADENIHRERLDLIVVCTQLERPHLIFAVAARREHDKRQLRQPMTDVLQQLVAVHTDALQLHQYQIIMFCSQAVQTGTTRIRHLGFIPAARQIVTQHGGKADVSVYDQYS